MRSSAAHCRCWRELVDRYNVQIHTIALHTQRNSNLLQPNPTKKQMVPVINMVAGVIHLGCRKEGRVPWCRCGAATLCHGKRESIPPVEMEVRAAPPRDGRCAVVGCTAPVEVSRLGREDGGHFREEDVRS